MSQAVSVLTAIPSARREPAPSRSPATSQRQQSRKALKALRRQSGAAIAIGAVGVTLVTLSLNHLAHGIELVTGAPTWEAWAMAIGIDLGFVALEASQLAAAGDKLRKQIARFTKPAIIGTLIGSAGMNAFAFAAQTKNLWMTAAAITLGIAIPALVYALMRVGAALWFDCHAKA
jgi:hypothetical protein